jgi:hypothetical protein
MGSGKSYNAEQLHRIYTAHVRICETRGIELTSPEGRQIARRLLTEFSGSEEETEITRKFLS